MRELILRELVVGNIRASRWKIGNTRGRCRNRDVVIIILLIVIIIVIIGSFASLAFARDSTSLAETLAAFATREGRNTNATCSGW